MEDGERMRAAVGEYLRALDELERLRRETQALVSLSDEHITACWDAARKTRLALAELRKSHSERGADGFAPRKRRPPVVPGKMRVWPIGRGQNV